MGLKQEFLTDSPEKTKKLGEILAQSLMNSVLICLSGDLGGGKTTFAQGFAAGLGIKEKITSPSFVLMKRYEISGIFSHSRPDRESRSQLLILDSRFPARNASQSLGLRWRARRGNDKQKKKFRFFYHFDCYRLNNPKEILALGWEDIVEDKNNIILVEWADKIAGYLPQGRIEIKFEILEEGKREIRVMSNA